MQLLYNMNTPWHFFPIPEKNPLPALSIIEDMIARALKLVFGHFLPIPYAFQHSRGSFVE
jgi:hypothetical protein